MRNLLIKTKIVTRLVFSNSPFNHFWLNMKKLIKNIQVEIKQVERTQAPANSPRMKRALLSRNIDWTRDILKGEGLEIGEYTYGVPTVWGREFHPDTKLQIGKFCSIAADVHIFVGMNHRADFVSTYPFSAFPDCWSAAERISYPLSTSKGDVVIGNDVWIGHGARILSGVRIGDGAVIGTSSVIVRDVEPYSIVGGNPARLLKKRFDDETIRRLLEIRWWDWPIEKINENLLIILSNRVSELLQVK